MLQSISNFLKYNIRVITNILLCLVCLAVFLLLTGRSLGSFSTVEYVQYEVLIYLSILAIPIIILPFEQVNNRKIKLAVIILITDLLLVGIAAFCANRAIANLHGNMAFAIYLVLSIILFLPYTFWFKTKT